MEGGDSPAPGSRGAVSRPGARYQLIVALVAALIFLGCIVSPPSLMDDVDAVQAQIARNMLQSGDWVTARLDGVAYLEKSPLKYWMIAVSFLVFGVHDWAARIPMALAAVLLCWVTARFGGMGVRAARGDVRGPGAGDQRGAVPVHAHPDSGRDSDAGDHAGAVEPAAGDWTKSEAHPRRWAMAMWAAMGTGLLLKGLIAAVFPVAAGLLYLCFTGSCGGERRGRGCGRCRGMLLLLAIAAPWHVLATLRNPPYFDFTMHSERGSYHGFFWFYFINEHVLRFLNLRYPRDYNTVPRLYFWLFHLLWLFPWSVYLPAALRGWLTASRTGPRGRA